MNKDKNKKNVLILSKEDTAQSIVAAAVLNRYLLGVNAYSAGVNKAVKIDPYVRVLLEENGLWSNEIAPKHIDALQKLSFELIILLDESLINKLPEFLQNTDTICIEYETPTQNSKSEYSKLLKAMQMEITPIVRMQLEL